ncbi:MAG: DUF374 domain-containing protein [Planctomycetota bacterium]
MKLPPQPIGWAIAAYVLLLRWTCRVRVHDDPRPAMRDAGEPYAYAILHAHQIAIVSRAEPLTAAMVSRSADGELLQPTFRLMRVAPKRGSNRRGGADALDAMVDHVRHGEGPAIIAVDGPRGPRGRVRKGIASLSIRAGAAVVCVVVVPRWRLVIRHAWDRFQVPLPLGRMDAHFAEPVRPEPGEGVEAFRLRVERTLADLERLHDPDQASAA